jgi:hypothetical protein
MRRETAGLIAIGIGMALGSAATLGIDGRWEVVAIVVGSAWIALGAAYFAVVR